MGPSLAQVFDRGAKGRKSRLAVILDEVGAMTMNYHDSEEATLRDVHSFDTRLKYYGDTAMRSIVVLMLGALVVVGCGIQSIPKAKNAVEASLAEVTNQYKRRADLVPNLVKTVKAYAAHEAETLQAVVEARASASKIELDPSGATPEQIRAFQNAQGSLSQALGRLMVVVERYPDLKADRNFRELQAQLEGTENRITIARQRYIEAIRRFNDQITVPPSSWTNSLFYHFEKMPQWTLEEAERQAVEQPPDVTF